MSHIVQVAGAKNEIGIDYDKGVAVIWSEPYSNWRLGYGFKDTATIDIEDITKVKRFRWTQQTGYFVSRSDHRMGTVFLHRIVMGLRKRNKEVVDHINRDRSDCRKSNLRVCTQQQNSRNRQGTNKSSGFAGVTWSESRGRWQAQIGFRGQKIVLGFFPDMQDAIIARDIASQIIDPIFFPKHLPNLEHTEELIERLAQIKGASCFRRTINSLREKVTAKPPE